MSLTYKVIIIGHEPPFKWSVRHDEIGDGVWKITQVQGVKMKSGPNGGSIMEEGLVTVKGTADTFEACLRDAKEAAEQADWERRHAAARYEEEILSVESVDIPGISL